MTKFQIVKGEDEEVFCELVGWPHFLCTELAIASVEVWTHSTDEERIIDKGSYCEEHATFRAACATESQVNVVVTPISMFRIEWELDDDNEMDD